MLELKYDTFQDGYERSMKIEKDTILNLKSKPQLKIKKPKPAVESKILNQKI